MSFIFGRGRFDIYTFTKWSRPRCKIGDVWEVVWMRKSGRREEEGVCFTPSIFSLIRWYCVSWAPGVVLGIVRRRFELRGVGSSGARFLHLLWRVPGRLSGPLRLGIASYSHSLFLRRQLLQSGLFESHRILRARLRRNDNVPILISLLIKPLMRDLPEAAGYDNRRCSLSILSWRIDHVRDRRLSWDCSAHWIEPVITIHVRAVWR